MIVEIDYPDTAIRAAVQRAAVKALVPDAWDKANFTGALADEVKGMIETQVREAFQALDLSAIIAEVIDAKMLPTVREIVEHQIRVAAKKAVKAEMEKRNGS